jgi:hypothetical protein
MAGLDPAIHVFVSQQRKTWMPGTRPGMTIGVYTRALAGFVRIEKRFGFRARRESAKLAIIGIMLGCIR